MGFNALLNKLLERIPELEWQLTKLGPSFSAQLLPKGLFNLPYDAPKSEYVAELKTDIQRLAEQSNPKAVRYLVEKINQKINVLVAVCGNHKRQASAPVETNFTVEKLTTRQEWLTTLEGRIQILIQQKNALAMRVSQLTANDVTQLNLKRELGELEKQLTIAEETYSRATHHPSS